MSSSLASTSSSEPPRTEALPLPRKVGEIGYVPPAQGEPEMSEVDLDEPTLPARHPADRDHNDPPSSSNPPSGADAATTAASASASAASAAAATASTAATSGESQPKKSHSWSLAGIRVVSIIRLMLLLGLMAGTGGAWSFTVRHFMDTMAANQRPTSTQTNSFGWSSTIFVHIAFSIVVLFEFVFLERIVFHIRAERYMFKHGMSPDARSDARRAATLGIAPWNRPPLPTYAAALAESGHGTGDVEDNLIAIVPPPAYGNTRGSVLLLSSMLPSNLVRSLSRASSRRSERERSTGTRARARSQEAEIEEGRRSRPLSYGASEEVSDAARARALELALARLENTARPQQPTPSTSSSSNS